MVAVPGSELVEQALGRWRPSDLAFIREIVYTGDAGRLRLEALFQPRPPLSVGWPDPAAPFWFVSLQFDGVRELSIHQQGTGDLQVAGFDIEDHSESQMEGVRFRVSDYEFDTLSFWAFSVRVLGCQACSSEPTSSPMSREYPGEGP